MRQLLILVSLCLASARLVADVVNTELVTLSVSGGVPAYYYRDKDEILKLETSAQGIGSPTAYRGSAVLALYKDPADLALRNSDQPAPPPALQATLPAGEDRVLLVFSTTQTPQGELRDVRVFGLSTKKMKAGDYRIFNFSRKSVYIIMDDEKAAIPSGQQADITSNAWRSGTSDMQVRFGLKEGEGLRQAYSSVWGHRPTRRTFLFIFERADEFRPFEIRSYHDVPLRRKPEAP